jgi:hypothetical protein
LTDLKHSVKTNEKNMEVRMSGTLSTHSIWSILPWEVPWDAGHFFFLGLAYLVLTVIGVTLVVVALKTKQDLQGSEH